jgi:hypothetical protein
VDSKSHASDVVLDQATRPKMLLMPPRIPVPYGWRIRRQAPIRWPIAAVMFMRRARAAVERDHGTKRLIYKAARPSRFCEGLLPERMWIMLKPIPQIGVTGGPVERRSRRTGRTFIRKPDQHLSRASGGGDAERTKLRGRLRSRRGSGLLLGRLGGPRVLRRRTPLAGQIRAVDALSALGRWRALVVADCLLPAAASALRCRASTLVFNRSAASA